LDKLSHSGATLVAQQQGFTTGEMGSEVILRSNNLQDRMSALGQKRTLRGVRLMSALPPKADIAERGWNVRYVPQADSCTAAKPSLFHRLIWSGAAAVEF
jgi:hypothetical protein